MITVWIIEVLTDSPTDPSGKYVVVKENSQAVPDPTALHLGVQRHEHLATTLRDESPRLLCACGWMAKPGRFTVTDRSGAPLHSLGYRQGFVGDHRLQRGAARCSVAAMAASRSPSAVSTSMASFFRRRSRWARSRRRAIQPCGAGQQARGLVRRQVDS
jgi:hypothetical protein